MDILFLSTKIFLGTDEHFIDGGIIVTDDGKIRKILRSRREVNSYIYSNESESVFDFDDKVLMPGLIDTNVHISEPGRTEWEGFLTATKAAAAGGFTTIIDRPLTTIPPTISADNFKIKAARARGKLFVDVGFWGGLVNNNIAEIDGLMQCGVIGFQCSLCPTGMPEFSHVDENFVHAALPKLNGSLLAFHAELPTDKSLNTDNDNCKQYKTFLRTRPESMEINAVKIIAQISDVNKNIQMHILNLSSAEAIPIIENCKKKGGKISIETCPHYLSLTAENVPDYRTEYKTCPPIRDKENQLKLWTAVQEQKIDQIVSDHSPSTPGVKCLVYGKNRGDFISARPGIGSLQFGLSIFWTHCCKYGLGILDVYRLFSANPAKLCGIANFKSKIEIGYDADFCIWDPDEEFTVSPDEIQFQNKANPYMNQKLRGVVHATVVRGLHVYQRYEGFGQPLGRVILRKTTKKIVKFSSRSVEVI